MIGQRGWLKRQLDDPLSIKSPERRAKIRAAIADLDQDIKKEFVNRREVESILSAKPVERSLDKKSYKTALGRNIDRYRMECGWSQNALEEATGIAKKLTIGHVKHGKNAQPKNLKLYAEVFTKQLGRLVTIAELLQE